MKKTCIALTAYLALLMSIDRCSARPRQPDPDQTQAAFGFLLRASKETIPAGSTCAGNYGTNSDPTIGDLISIQLSYLNRGRNTISGKCAESKRCHVRISHAFGEDVSSAEISFDVTDAKLDLKTLHCVMTP